MKNIKNGEQMPTVFVFSFFKFEISLKIIKLLKLKYLTSVTRN